MNASFRKYAAEFIGTFVLVLFGCGSAATAGGELGHLGIELKEKLGNTGSSFLLPKISHRFSAYRVFTFLT